MKYLTGAFVLALVLIPALSVGSEVLVWTDGSRMQVQRYEMRGALVVITTLDGKLRSVPRNLIDLEATESLNRVPAESQHSRTTAPRSPSNFQGASQESPDMPSPRTRSPAPHPPVDGAAVATTAELAGEGSASAGPRLWSDEKLRVSLILPSTWQVQLRRSSVDEAVRLQSTGGPARATLVLIPGRTDDYTDFQRIVGEIQKSVAALPGFRRVGGGSLASGLYTAEELQFLEEKDGGSLYERLVVYY